MNLIASYFLIFLMAAILPCEPDISMQNHALTQGMHEQAQNIVLPCSPVDFRSDRHYFRGTGSGSHQNRATAERIARLDANANLAAAISVTIHSVIDRYVMEQKDGTEASASQRYTELTSSVTDQQLRHLNIACSEAIYNNGRFTVYMAVEVPKDNVLHTIENETSEGKTDLDFQKSMFERIFNEEMEKLEKEKDQ